MDLKNFNSLKGISVQAGGRRKRLTWQFTHECSTKIYKDFFLFEWCCLLEWRDSWDFNVQASNHETVLIFCNQILALFLLDLSISLTVTSISSSPTGKWVWVRRKCIHMTALHPTLITMPHRVMCQIRQLWGFRLTAQGSRRTEGWLQEQLLKTKPLGQYTETFFHLYYLAM